ncbi:MAG: RsmE family RNA methyltransferase [Bacteriovoracaceae bacterium]
MRAIFEPQLKCATIDESYVVHDDSFHHLANVVRVKLGEFVKIFNGDGLEVTSEVSLIEKKQLKLKFLSVKNHERKGVVIDVLIGTPKKEALEQCLKQSVELGVRRIFLAETAFSQKHFISTDRQQSLLVSSLEQSNNPFLPIIEEIKFQEAPVASYDQVILFDSVNKELAALRSGAQRLLLVLGPEGGFSVSELEWWKSHPQTVSIHLPTAIMRTPTALSCAIGFTLGKLN